MNKNSNERGRLLHIERGNERTYGLWVLGLAIFSSFVSFLLFLSILKSFGDSFPDINVVREFWWILLLAVFMVPSITYAFSFFLILTKRGPLKVFENGIEPRKTLIQIMRKDNDFIYFNQIERITQLYRGWEQEILDGHIKDLSFEGIRIRTKDQRAYDISITIYSSHFTSFDYELIQILTKNMGSRWKDTFSIRPDYKDEEWMDISNRMQRRFYGIQEYGFKQAIITSISTIPGVITVILMARGILTGWSLMIIFIISIFLMVGSVPFISYKIMNYWLKTSREIGAVFRAQEYELLYGEKILPSNFQLMDRYIYPEKDFPNIKQEFWRDVENDVDQKFTRSNPQKRLFLNKIENHLRYERLTKKRIIPDHIRQLREVRAHIAKLEGEEIKGSKRLKAYRKMRMKTKKMHQALEEGRSISLDINHTFKSLKEIHLNENY
jgi:hypothetical protein